MLQPIRRKAPWLASSSSPVEKVMDVVIGRRLKSKGTSWHRPGAHRLLTLRILKQNRTWNRYSAARRSRPAAGRPGSFMPKYGMHPARPELVDGSSSAGIACADFRPQGGQRHEVVARSTLGGGLHSPVDWTAQWNGGNLATNAAVTALPGQQAVFWGGVNQHLWEAWYTTRWNGPVDWTQVWGG